MSGVRGRERCDVRKGFRNKGKKKRFLRKREASDAPMIGEVEESFQTILAAVRRGAMAVR